MAHNGRGSGLGDQTSDSPSIRTSIDQRPLSTEMMHLLTTEFQLTPLPLPSAIDTQPHASNSTSSVSEPFGSSAHQTESKSQITSMQTAMDEQPSLRVSERKITNSSSIISQRLGLFVTASLFTSTLGILTSLAFITFLWFSYDSNKTWRHIAVSDWMTRSVALSSLTLRTSITIQGGIATSMLASIALEHKHALLLHLPSISTIRNSNSGPYHLAWMIFLASRKKFNVKRETLIRVWTFLLCLTVFLSQFTSTVLLSDVKVGVITGTQKAVPMRTGYDRSNVTGGPDKTPVDSSALWTAKPPFYPTFAEFRNETTAYSGMGVGDTGVNLRAFLPIFDSGARSSIQNYTGAATVIDTRVLCMAPNITNFTFVAYHYPVTDDNYNISGNVGPTDTITQFYNMSRTDTSILRVIDDGSEYRGFNCSFLPAARINICELRGDTSQSTSICSELYEYCPTSQQTYLLIESSGWPFGSLPFSGPPKLTQNYTENEWLQLEFWNPNGPSYNLSLSLCYTALGSANLQVKATSGSLRTEPSPQMTSNNWSFINVLNQLGQFNSSTEQRGILDLGLPPKRTWDNTDIDVDFLSRSASMDPQTQYFNDMTLYFVEGGPPQYVSGGEVSRFAQADFVTLMQDMLSLNGSSAFVLQSMLTIIASMSYYNQAPGFDNTTTVLQTLFVQAQIPGGGSNYIPAPHGWSTPYIGIFSLTLVHITMMISITLAFFLRTSISNLNNSWQTISQIHGPETQEYLANAHLTSDSEVEGWLRDSGYEKTLVGIRLSDDGRRTKLVGLRRRQN